MRSRVVALVAARSLLSANPRRGSRIARTLASVRVLAEWMLIPRPTRSRAPVRHGGVVGGATRSCPYRRLLEIGARRASTSHGQLRHCSAAVQAASRFISRSRRMVGPAPPRGSSKSWGEGRRPPSLDPSDPAACERLLVVFVDQPSGCSLSRAFRIAQEQPPPVERGDACRGPTQLSEPQFAGRCGVLHSCVHYFALAHVEHLATYGTFRRPCTPSAACAMVRVRQSP